MSLLFGSLGQKWMSLRGEVKAKAINILAVRSITYRLLFAQNIKASATIKAAYWSRYLESRRSDGDHVHVLHSCATSREQKWAISHHQHIVQSQVFIDLNFLPSFASQANTAHSHTKGWEVNKNERKRFCLARRKNQCQHEVPSLLPFFLAQQTANKWIGKTMEEEGEGTMCLFIQMCMRTVATIEEDQLGEEPFALQNYYLFAWN